MKFGDQLHYAQNARSVHVLLRVTDDALVIDCYGDPSLIATSNA